jgi:hypothetical protein
MAGGGKGDLEMVVKEEMVVVAKGKLLKSRLPRRSEKHRREAQGARCQERRNAAPPSARKEPPHLVTPEAS